MSRLQGKVALVTGAARGLGFQIAKRLSREGVCVALADVREDLVGQAAESLAKEGAKCSGHVVDVRSYDSVMHFVETVLGQHGKINAVVNNAAIDHTQPIEELSASAFQDVIQTNLNGPFLMAKAAFPILSKNGDGHIINIVSTAAKRAWPNASAYHASKWGLLGLSYALHAEMRPANVKVTAVIAGGMQTPFLLDRFPDIDVNNLQNPANVAEVIPFLMSMPMETVIPEIMVIPMRETSWP